MPNSQRCTADAPQLRAGMSANVSIDTGHVRSVAELVIGEIVMLLRRIPTLALAAPLEEIPFKNDKLAYGVYELPVTW